MRNDIVHLIGPGGAGKSTAGARLARELGYGLIDLDEYFVAHSGDISAYLCNHTYSEYAKRNFANYREAMTTISSPTVFVLSSGFMVYPAEIDLHYAGTREAVESSPLTFLLMPSFELEDCVAMIVERQLLRPYLLSNRGSEERRIRERFGPYPGPAVPTRVHRGSTRICRRGTHRAHGSYHVVEPEPSFVEFCLIDTNVWKSIILPARTEPDATTVCLTDGRTGLAKKTFGAKGAAALEEGRIKVIFGLAVFAKRLRLVNRMCARFTRCFLIVCAVAAVGMVQSVDAQSGRRRPVAGAGSVTGSAPAVNSEPAKAPAVGEERSDEKSVKITSLLVAGQIFHPYAYYNSSFLGTALKECVNALKAHPVGVAKAGEMKFDKARELAKKESEVVVLWLGFETKDDGYGNQYLEYVDYAVLLPRTAKILTNGRIKPGEASPAITSGGVVSLPRRTTRSSPVQADLQMRFIAHEVVNRLTLGGWIN